MSKKLSKTKNTEEQYHTDIEAVGEMLQRAIIFTKNGFNEDDDFVDNTLDCVYFAMNHIKDNPSATITAACKLAIKEKCL